MKSKLLSTLILLLLTKTLSFAQTIVYVNINATGANNGTSWANAFTNLKTAINAAPSNSEIWVAKGKYLPSVSNRTQSFSLKNNVSIYGGFQGIEASKTQRDSKTNESILSGDIGVVNDSSDNTYNIFSNNNIGNTAIMDGFTISDAFGNAYASGMSNNNASPTLSNIVFKDNYAAFSGAGMYNIAGSNPVIRNVIFINNYTSEGDGAGMYNDSSSPELTNVCFINNTSAAGGGGGIYNVKNSSPNLLCVTFYGNKATTNFDGGGGMYSKNSSPIVTNCIFWGNKVDNTITNSIAGNLGTVTYSDVEMSSGTYTGTGNINTNPLFVDANNPKGNDNIYMTFDDGLRIQTTSPCKNMGNGSVPQTDITGTNRSGTIDMGAYEYTACYNNFTNNIAYVNASATGANTGLNWTDAFKDLQSALNHPCKSTLTQIWVAKGIYYPSVSDQAKSFELLAGVKILGGFSGNETFETQRNPQLNQTILSGDLGVKFPASSYNTDNSNHVVTSNGVDATTVLDGFTIQRGGISAGTVGSRGGGIYNLNASPTLANLVILGNLSESGAGMCNFNSSPKVTNTVFESNTGIFGGGICNLSGSNGEFQNVVFYANAANGFGLGGGLLNDDSSPKLTNCTFYKNTTAVAVPTINGSSMCNKNSANPIITNTIMWGNSSVDVVSVFNLTGSNPTITYSNIQQPTGVYAGTGNLNADPQFKRPTDPNGADNTWLTSDDGLGLTLESPVLDQGTTVTFLKDILSKNHLKNPEMGAYEYSGCENTYTNNIIYVNATATGKDDGTTWTNAYKNLQDALYTARNCSSLSTAKIWVAKGTYKPTIGTDREIFFEMRNNLAIYGGFLGNETNLTDRNWENNPTILDGNIGSITNDEFANPDNSRHVIHAVNLDATAILDGFTIQNGSASEIVGIGDGVGAGIYSNTSNAQFTNLIITQNFAFAGGGGAVVLGGSPTFTNVTFLSNYSFTKGGGMYVYGSSGSPKLKKVLFSKNLAANEGGGMSNELDANPVFEQVVFAENEARPYNTPTYGFGVGGGMSNNQICAPKLTNVVFWKNKANLGGGMYNYNNYAYGNYSKPEKNAKLVNVTFYQNVATNNDGDGGGGGIFSGYYTNPTASNVIVWDNTNGNIVNSTYENEPAANSIVGATYSDIQMATTPAYSGTGNLNVNPKFINPTNPIGADGKWFTDDDGLQLAVCSPLLNVGNNSSTTITTDIAGKPRIFNTTIDMGAYESQSLPIIAPTGTANATVCGGSSISLSATCQAGTAKWYETTGTTLQGSGTTFSTPNLTVNTTYKVRCEDDNCSSSFVSVGVTIKPNAPPTANSDSPKCAGNLLTFTGGGTGMFKWTGPSTYSSSAQSPKILTASVANSGVYTLTLTNTNSCIATATTQVVINPSPDATLSATPTAVCQGGTVTFSVPPQPSGTKYYWNGYNIPYYRGNPNYATADVTSTDYNVTVENLNGCSGVGEIKITVKPTPDKPLNPTATPSVLISSGTVTLSADACANGGTLIWYETSSNLPVPTPNDLPTVLSTKSFYGRCKVGDCLSDKSAKVIVSICNPLLISPGNVDITWVGEIDSDWTKPCNWSPQWVPDSTSANVIIPSGSSNNPLISVLVPSIKALFIDPSASLEIGTDGVLNIRGNGVEDQGILLTNSTLTNNGKINIESATQTPVLASIYLKAQISESQQTESPTLVNYGEIHIRSTDVGIGVGESPVIGAVVHNYFDGKIIIENGIGVKVGSPNDYFTFENKFGGNFIYNGNDLALSLQGNTDFQNYSYVEINSGTGILNKGSATLTNSDCGRIIMKAGGYVNESTTINDAYLEMPNLYNFTNTGIFTNNGVLKANSVTGIVNNVSQPFVEKENQNNGIIITNNCPFITKSTKNYGLFLTGIGSDFSYGGANINFTNAGTYTESTNKFVANNTIPIGSQTLYVIITNGNVEGCFFAVPFTFNNKKPTPVSALSNTICAGQSVNLSATCESGTALNWYTTETGGTGNTSGSFTPNVNSTYYAACEAPNCVSGRIAFEVIVKLIPNAPTASNVSICSGLTASLSATCASGSSAKWYDSATGGTSLSSSSTYTTMALTAQTDFYAACETDNSESFISCQSSTRTKVTVSIYSLPNATISGTTSVCKNAAQPNITFTGSGGTTPYTFTYKIGSGANQTVSTTTGNSVTVSAPTSSVGVFTYNLLNVADVNCSKMTSGSAVVSIENPTIITTQPQNTNICEKSSGTLSVVATGTGLTYQWEYQDDDNGSWNDWGTNSFGTTTGADSPTMTHFPAVTINTVYPKLRCRITSTGACAGVVYSDEVTILIKESTNVYNQPYFLPTCEGDDKLRIYVVVRGSSVAYQWQVDKNDGSGYQNLTGGGSILDIPNPTSALNGYKYRCIISSACSAPITSNSVTINILIPPSIQTQPVNKNACVGSEASFSVSATGSNLTYAWSVISGGITTAIPDANTSTLTLTNVNSSMNSNKYVCTVNNLCKRILTNEVTLTVNPKPTITLNSNSPVCQGNSLNLGANGGVSYNWVGTSFTSTEQNPVILNVNNSSSGTYTVTVVDANSCLNTATTSVIINTLPTATASSNTPSVCVGNTLNLSSSGGTSYVWKSLNGFISTEQNPTITNAIVSNSGTYTVTVTNVNGCTSTATTSVTVNPNPLATASSNSPICAGTALNLTGGGVGSYAWTSTNGFTSNDQSPSISNASVSNTGTYKITVTNVNGCTSTATTAVTVNPNPTAIASSNSSICAENTLNLTGGGVGSYAWTSSNGFTSTDQNPSIPNVSILASGTYKITVTNANGCTSTATTSVTVNALPMATASSNSPVCSGATLNLSGGGVGSYAWTSTNIFTSTDQNPTIPNVSILLSGTYKITVTNVNGCTSTATTYVTVNPVVNPPNSQANTQIIFGTSITLTATGCSNVNDVMKWYKSSDNSLAVMPVSPTGTTYYYAKCERTLNGITCISGNSTDVTVTVLSLNPPVATGVTNCLGTPTTLSATGCSGNVGTFVLKWYLNATDALVTMPVSPTTTIDYYAKCEQTFNSVTAISDKSNVVTLTILNPQTPISTGGTIYKGQSISLTATGCTGALGTFTLKWYQTSDNLLVTMPVSPTVTTQYYSKCEQTANSVTCLSPKGNDVTVTVVNRIFVDIAKVVAPIQNGNSWATAYGNLQTGLAAATAGVEVWVAKGTYKATNTTDRNISFIIPSGVKVYGGFKATEDALIDRDFRTNISVLSGDIGTPNNQLDNTYHLVRFDGSNNETLFDGFTLTLGNASFDPKTNSNNNLLPLVPSVTVDNKSGGAIVISNSAQPKIVNCILTKNQAWFGGAIFCVGSTPTIDLCTITNNEATFGAAMYNQDGGNSLISNTLMAVNRALGCVYNNNSNPVLSNCTIASNGGYNGGIFNSNSSPVINNSIIWGNSTPLNDTQSNITNSMVQGGYVGLGNLNYDPQFINQSPSNLASNTNGDFHLMAKSLAIDRGTNGSISLKDKDLDGNLRRYAGGRVDMGAYEFQGIATSTIVISFQTGNWESNSTWDIGRVPQFGDYVIISNNHIVTLNGIGVAKTLEYRGTGTLKYNSKTSKLEIGF